MNNRFFEQTEQFFKPMADIAALNAKTFEALAEKQTGLMTEMWSHGVDYAKELSDKRDVESLYSSQKDFWENMNQKFSTTAQESFALLTDAQEQMTELVQDTFASADFGGVANAFGEGADQAAETAETATGAAQDQAEKASAATQQTAKSAGKAGEKAQSQSTKSASKSAKSSGSQAAKG